MKKRKNKGVIAGEALLNDLQKIVDSAKTSILENER